MLDRFITIILFCEQRVMQSPLTYGITPSTYRLSGCFQLILNSELRPEVLLKPKAILGFYWYGFIQVSMGER